MHNRIRSEPVVPELVQTPDSFRDEFCTMVTSPLPYTGTNAQGDVDEKGMFKNPRISQAGGESGTDEGNLKGPTGAMAAWLKIANYYDLAYHRLKQHWIIFCVFLLAGIVSCSLAIGWAFRLKTFNIADPDSITDSIVRLYSASCHALGTDVCITSRRSSSRRTWWTWTRWRKK